jgi:hypothetical protein
VRMRLPRAEREVVIEIQSVTIHPGVWGCN